MKRSPLSLVILWMGMSQSHSHAVTSEEQAAAFFARGVAAEQRGDFIAAENCFLLTLRVIPGHLEATEKLADFERRNVVGAEARASIITLPQLNYNLRDMSDGERETKFLETLSLLNRLTGIEFSLETEGEPVPPHWLNLRNVTVEEAMRKIAEYSGLTVTYDRNVIRLSPKTAETEASPETREKLTRLKERVQTELASVTEPRRENLEKLGASIDAEYAALVETVKAAPDDLAAVKGGRAKAAYLVRSEILRDQPGSFTKDAEGWTMFDTKGTATQAVEHHPSGYLHGKDLIEGSDYYFSAPQSLLDRIHAATTEASISFDFYTTATDNGIKDFLVLESPKTTIVLPAGKPPIREWKPFAYRFDASAGWKVGSIGKIGKKLATEEEIQQVLSTVTKLYIRGEWKSGPDAARLDNVVITENDPPVNPSTPGVDSPQSSTKPGFTSVPPFPPSPPAPESSSIAVRKHEKEPTSSSDPSIAPRLWTKRKGAFEFHQHDFPEPIVVEGCDVYWFSDGGETLLPDYWKVLYLNKDGHWMPVDTAPGKPVANSWNQLRFAPVRTKGLRLVAQLQWKRSAGFLEWKILPSAGPPPADPSYPEALRLDDLFPAEAKTEFAPYRVNRYNDEAERDGATVKLDGKRCEHFLFTHASASIRFDVPPGYEHFSATAMGPIKAGRKNYAWAFRVFADGKPIFDGPDLGTTPNRQYPIDVALPSNTRTITLIADPLGKGENDHAIWVDPRLVKATN